MTEWQQAQEFEANWHNTIGTNTYFEEMKQLVYANRMGIEIYKTPETPYNIKNYGSIVDIGGGEVSLLLKVQNPKGCIVVDPLNYPLWALERYKSKGIDFKRMRGEDFVFAPDVQTIFDEAWIYNCCQHTDNPKKIIKNAKKVAKIIRIFEWLDTPVSPGHIHTLAAENLDKWLGGTGRVEQIHEQGCMGKCYYGIFMGDNK